MLFFHSEQINENILYGEEHLKVARILHSIHPKGFIVCARYRNTDENKPNDEQTGESDDLSMQSTNLEPQSDLDDIQFARPATGDDTITNGSNGSSDVDRNPTPSRVIIARSMGLPNKKEVCARNNAVVTLKRTFGFH